MCQLGENILKNDKINNDKTANNNVNQINFWFPENKILERKKNEQEI